MFVPAVRGGTIGSIRGTTLKISHRTAKKLFEVSGGFFEKFISST